MLVSCSAILCRPWMVILIPDSPSHWKKKWLFCSLLQTLFLLCQDSESLKPTLWKVLSIKYICTYAWMFCIFKIFVTHLVVKSAVLYRPPVKKCLHIDHILSHFKPLQLPSFTLYISTIKSTAFSSSVSFASPLVISTNVLFFLLAEWLAFFPEWTRAAGHNSPQQRCGLSVSWPQRYCNVTLACVLATLSMLPSSFICFDHMPPDQQVCRAHRGRTSRVPYRPSSRWGEAPTPRWTG